MENVLDLVDTVAEAGVISTLLYHPDFLLVDNMLRDTFFYEKENKAWFWAIRNLVEQGVTNIDVVNLENMFAKNSGVQKIIAESGMADIQKRIVLSESASRDTYEEYKLLAENVITCAFRRELNSVAKGISKECFNTKLSLDDLNEYVDKGINGLVNRFILGTDSVQFAEKIDKIWEEICNDRNDDGTYGIPNKIASLNEYFTLGKGELVLVAGQTGRGKSSYFLNQVTFALEHGISCVILDTELTNKVILPRILANISGVRVRDIKTGNYGKEDEKKIKDAIIWLKKQNFVHEYVPVFNKIKIEQICRKWHNSNKMDFLVYDYIKPTERYGAAEISQSLGLMADFLKSIAGNMEIPVLAGLQLNQQTGYVSDSQKPERYADVLMYWKEKTAEQLNHDGLDSGNYLIEIRKNRNGATTGENDYIDIRFIGDLMRITEAKKHGVIEQTPFDD